MVYDQEVAGKVTQKSLALTIEKLDDHMTREKLEQIAESENQRRAEFRDGINVCVATGCLASKSQMVKDALDREVANRGWEKHCQVKGVGCLGLCSKGRWFRLVRARYTKRSPPQMQATFSTMQEKHHCVVCFARRIYRSFTPDKKS